MNNARLVLSALTLLGCLAGFSVLFPNNQRGAPVEPPAPQGTLSPAQVAPAPSPSPSAAVPLVGDETTLRGRDAQGRPTWELHAASIVLKDAEKRLAAERVRCTFFGEQRQAVATLVAKGADMNTTSQNLLFRGQVVAVTPKGDRLTIERLLYDGARKKFFGTGGICLKRPDGELTGDTLVGDPGLKTVTVRGHVVAHLRQLPPPGKASGGSTPPAHPSAQGGHGWRR